MKMFIWADPYSVSYGSSLLVAVAETLEDAKKQAIDGKAFSYGIYENGNGGKVELGEPTRVLDAPCAEWHQWSE